MSSAPFVHLHCHSHYSMLDGAAQVKNLVAQAKSLGMNSLALTDHGNLFGAIEFYETCRNAGLNPIIGYEAYVAPGHRTDRQARGGVGGEASFHLTMLAQNATGFRNLIKLASQAYLEGFYYKPRIDKELIEQCNEGLIVLSGCASSEFSKFILGDRLDDAVALAEWFARVFSDRFYIEIQDNGLELQKECARGAIDIAGRLGLPLVATCDTHYLCSADADAHEVLLCINTGKTMNDANRLRYGSNEFYLKPPEEMYASFPNHAEAVKQSQLIADSVSIELDFNTRHFPVYDPPPGKTDKDYLREKCEEGMVRRLGDAATQEYRDRLDLELAVIEKLGFSSYFLITWDFVDFANRNGIPCGARGSACGALVSYLLGFSNVDPLTYDLLFERFLDPSRAEAPDIDIDFCQQRRDEVIRYAREKYGEDNVAQIITFGTMAARAVVRDVGRALDIPLPRVDQIAKLIPKVLKITLTEALEQSPELKKEYDGEPEIRRLIDIGMRLEGLARNAGTHAAGVVVADRPLVEYVPLQKNGDVVTTQWEMSILEKVGMLKVDFLGLRNLTLLTVAVEMIRKVRGVDIDLLAIPLDEPNAYRLLQRGETKGVFQLESEGIRNLLVRMKPDRFEDIIATAALYRPGPLGGGMVDKYIDVKHGREKAEYVHPVMKDVLEETYGVMVYQEQVMRILNRLGGIELADAYKCIKAISKKKLETIAKYQSQFLEGAGEKGLDQKKAEEIFALIEHFAGYGFNKSHSTAYALIAFQTAYLKASYPAEFMAALMSSEVDKTDLLVDHIDDCKRMKIDVKAPDVNEGDVNFTVVDGAIRFGLVAIKGAGEKAIEAIVAERDATGVYKNIFDFCERIDSRVVNKTCIDGLIKAGAFDSFGARRAQLAEVLEKAIRTGADKRSDRVSGQTFLFDDVEDDDEDESVQQALPDITEWSDRDLLAYEKAVLGIYLSSHPISEYQRTLRRYRTHEVSEVAALSGGKEVTLGGMITAVRLMNQQRGRNAGQRYARFQFEDLSASISSVMFADTYAEYTAQVVNDTICFVRAEVDTSRDEVGLIVNEVISIEKAPERLAGAMWLRFDSNLHDTDKMDSVAKLLGSRPGPSSLFLSIDTPDGIRATMKAGSDFTVASDDELVGQVEAILGEGHVSFGPAVATSNGSSNGNGVNGRGKRRSGH